MNTPLTTPQFWDDHYGTDCRKHYPSILSRADVELARGMEPFLREKFGGTLFEVGCGNSYWLPYFARKYSFRVSGLDFSKERLIQADMNLSRHNLHVGDLIWGDILDGPQTPNKFDVVCSFGVIEHFSDPSRVLSILSSYLEPDGILITTVPCRKEFFGKASRSINRTVAEGYLELNLEDVIGFHNAAGLEIVHKTYFRWMDFGVINFAGLPKLVQFPTIGAVLGLNTLLRLVPERLITKLPSKYCADTLTIARRSHEQ